MAQAKEHLKHGVINAVPKQTPMYEAYDNTGVRPSAGGPGKAGAREAEEGNMGLRLPSRRQGVPGGAACKITGARNIRVCSQNHTWPGRIEAQDGASGKETGEVHRCWMAPCPVSWGQGRGSLQQAAGAAGFVAGTCLIHTERLFPGSIELVRLEQETN